MNRAHLVRELRQLDPPTPAACFVLVWTWLLEQGLGQAENRLRAQRRHPLYVEPYHHSSMETGLTDIGHLIDELRSHVEDSDEFEPLVLKWLKGLDLMLDEEKDATFDNVELPGIKGDLYLIKRRNNFIATFYEGMDQSVHSDAVRSGSPTAYARHHVLVPTGRKRGRRILSLPEKSWGGRHLPKRLKEERRRLRIMIWPLMTPIRFPALEELPSDDEAMAFVSLRAVGNEDELEREIKKALAAARRERATVLLLPELCVTTRIHRRIQEILADHGAGAHPVLTLFGCCHRPNATGNLDLNEAVLLGADGTELHRHKKLTAFTDMGAKLAERLEVGDVLSVLESPIGNLVPLICLDLFHDEVGQLVRESHGNVFLVPSWSDKTSAHDNAAARLRGTSLASTFVCNRRFSEPLDHPKGASFYYVPCRGPDGHTAHSSNRSPYLLFELGASTLQLVVK